MPPSLNTFRKNCPPEDLLNGLLSRNNHAYTYLYQAYSPALLATIKRIIKCPLTSEDILQDVFEKIWLHITSYSALKGSLYTWMSTITRNETISYLRSKQGKNSKITSLTDGDPFQSMTVFPGTSRMELLNALTAITEIEREIITLYKTGFSTKEISEIISIPQGTVKTKMRCAYKKLRPLLQ